LPKTILRASDIPPRNLFGDEMLAPVRPAVVAIGAQADAFCGRVF